MCDLITALTLAGTALGAVGQIQQGQATAAASRYNAKVAKMNADISERQARDALERGKLEEQKKRTQVQQVLGRQKAAMAANGVDLGFGSPLDTLVDTATMGEIDALTIRSNSAREAYDYRVRAANGQAQANLDNMNADAAETAGYLGAAGTLLTGAGSAFASRAQRSIGAIS
jgi:hypothetical protein